ncbi:MAG: FMN-binding glutamate synthase family protein [Gammaproteobacteria bacterium]|nr:FMN-binding glutamate synthase family protein [Gammaproteobacteria bacterium]
MLESDTVLNILLYFATLFIALVGSLALLVAVIYIRDITQTKQAIRKNYPVIGRFRYLFERLGTFFRQYFFAMDREELPFNRAERSWVYRAAKALPNTTAFGSTRDLKHPGTILFVNCPFPLLGLDTASVAPVTIGPQSRKPYSPRAFFHISGMSYGAISKPAVLALSHGAKMANCWLNTGEGGLSPYHIQGGADLVFQIGTAKYGVRDENGMLSEAKLRELGDNDQIKMFEIKLSQGAKPGKGGILPGQKVTDEVAHIRGIPVGKSSISPNRHPDIGSVDQLLDMIHKVRQLSGKPVGFKVVIGAYGWLDELFAEIVNRGQESAPDFITIDSADGGTGAAPMSLMDYMGLSIKESLPLVANKLRQYDLSKRVKLIASGKLITPADVAWALCCGADFVVSARGFMFALGCIQALQCNQNTCPTGITTHDRHLQKGLDPEHKAIRVMNYAKGMEHEVGVIAHSCGVREPRELQRIHARIVTENGRSISLEEAYANV